MSGSLGCYGHVMRTNEYDFMKRMHEGKTEDVFECGDHQ